MQQLKRHNSCVAFSFIADATSSNARKLTRLNGLFHYLADRKTGGIRADKLHDLIIKAGLCQLKCQRLEAFLFPKLKADNVEVYSKEKLLFGCTEKTKVDVRVISRGPFLAVFKDEPMNIINSLMQAVVSSRKKRSKKSVQWQITTATTATTQQKADTSSTNLKCYNGDDQTRSITSKNVSMSVRTKVGHTYESHWNDDSIRNNHGNSNQNYVSPGEPSNSFQVSPRSSATDLTQQNTVDQYTMQQKKDKRRKKKRSKRRSRKSNETTQQTSQTNSMDYRQSSQHSYIVNAHNSETNKQDNRQVYYGNPDTNLAEVQGQEFYENRMHRQHRQCHSDGPNFLSMDMTGILMQDIEEQHMMRRDNENDVCDILSGFTRFIQNIGGRKEDIVF